MDSEDGAAFVGEGILRSCGISTVVEAKRLDGRLIERTGLFERPDGESHWEWFNEKRFLVWMGRHELIEIPRES